MKRINLLLQIVTLLTILMINESCDNEEEIVDPCANISCQNNGTCIEGICDCPEGFLGTNCESFDPVLVQNLLSSFTPLELVNGDVPLDSLYGKIYQGGIIFYLNTTDGTGMVAAIEDQGSRIKWGCEGVDILELNNPDGGPRDPEVAVGARIGDGAANTSVILTGCTQDEIAAKICRDLGAEWFLPSRGELDLMYTNLYAKGHGGFTGDGYLSSTEKDENRVWGQVFNGDGQFTNNGDQILGFKDSFGDIRAGRAF